MNAKVAVGFHGNTRNFTQRPKTHRSHVVRLSHLARQEASGDQDQEHRQHPAGSEKRSAANIGSMPWGKV